MKLLNRSALLVLPRQPYLDWVNALPSEISELEQPLSLAALEVEGRVYLLDEAESDELDADQLLAEQLQHSWQSLLENELGAWDELGRHWPEPLSQQLLQEWFELKPLSLAFDAAAEPLMLASL
ncbi:hypothetical protein DV711_06800 [Motiliproteus coralliicola]|uniref:VacJ n=1 Tax=Motiliproteus coralliicola TaxID=2283196 RepID=A0A369WVW0_9GAMM|nr:hypothetical protein [Motiliproteus coralliicola]RDE25253.1 hypothetical protein DV711_06800 [Motiliproteus coralliicola]